MADKILLTSWAITRTHLEHAQKALSFPPTDALHDQYHEVLQAYQEFLEQNELELALDMLEELGELVACQGAFWHELECAAQQMQLKERIPYLQRKFSESSNNLNATQTTDDGS